MLEKGCTHDEQLASIELRGVIVETLNLFAVVHRGVDGIKNVLKSVCVGRLDWADGRAVDRSTNHLAGQMTPIKRWPRPDGRGPTSEPLQPLPHNERERVTQALNE